jgi:hypothetical protein
MDAQPKNPRYVVSNRRRVMVELVERYIQQHELKPGTETYYRRVFSVWLGWSGGKQPTADGVSEFLRKKQLDGLSSYSRKSYRNALVALLRFSGDLGPVRPVKLDPLDPEAWTPDEVRQLVSTAAAMFNGKDREWWVSLIDAAYSSGFNWCDLSRIAVEDVGPDGVLKTHRSKTGKRAVVYVPRRCVEWAGSGLVWKWPHSAEWFRRRFASIVKRAGLVGTFKRLRKTAGNAVEDQWPGHGHEYLANSRSVFEAHYQKRADGLTIRPPDLRMA